MNDDTREFLRQAIRTIPDYPKAGIQFRDITTLLRDRRAFKLTIETLCERWQDAAVDKVVGRMVLEDRLPLTAHVIMISGRASFEIVQKAWIAGVEVICAVSAPSSLAIDLADQAGITLVGFVRERGFNVYTHPHRLTGL